jgi:hypothetical protein
VVISSRTALQVQRADTLDAFVQQQLERSLDIDITVEPQESLGSLH